MSLPLHLTDEVIRLLRMLYLASEQNREKTAKQLGESTPMSSVTIPKPVQLRQADELVRKMGPLQSLWQRYRKRLKRSEGFRAAVLLHPEADDKLKRHVRAVGGLQKGEHIRRVASETHPKRRYTLKLMSSGRVGCTCPDWYYKKSHGGGDCKHVRKFKTAFESGQRPRGYKAMLKGASLAAFYDEIEKIASTRALRELFRTAKTQGSRAARAKGKEWVGRGILKQPRMVYREELGKGLREAMPGAGPSKQLAVRRETAKKITQDPQHGVPTHGGREMTQWVNQPSGTLTGGQPATFRQGSQTLSPAKGMTAPRKGAGRSSAMEAMGARERQLQAAGRPMPSQGAVEKYHQMKSRAQMAQTVEDPTLRGRFHRGGRFEARLAQSQQAAPSAAAKRPGWAEGATSIGKGPSGTQIAPLQKFKKPSFGTSTATMPNLPKL